jgi:predicted Fe-S protein YdhL (DUF1289 family)
MCGGEVQPKPSGLSASDRRVLNASRSITAAMANIPSPCISVCHMSDESGLCEGCWRTLHEIAGWGSASAAFKHDVWQRIQQRLLDKETHA